MMNRMTRRLWAALLFLPLASCLEFEKQTILIRAEPGDVLSLRLIYEGFYYSDASSYGGGEVVDAAKALAGMDRVAFFLGPLGTFDLEQLEQSKEEDPEAAMLLRNVSITGHGFFLNPEGKLSGWSDLRITSASAVLGMFNAWVNQLTEESLADAEADEDMDAETISLCRAASLRGHSWLRIDADGLVVSFFASGPQWSRWKEEALQGLLPSATEVVDANKAAKERAAGADLLQFLCGNDFSILREGGSVQISLRADSSGVTTLSWPIPKDAYTPELYEAVTAAAAPADARIEISAETTLQGLLDGFRTSGR